VSDQAKPEKQPRLYSRLERLFRDRGLVPVPVGDDKRPLVKGWAHDRSDHALDRNARNFPDANIGLLAGTALSNGNVLAFVDIDHDGIVPFVCEAIGGSPCAKKGRKGRTLFVQAERGAKSAKILDPQRRPCIEIMASTGMTVIPPSLHPSGSRYEWIGTPLLDVELTTLPLLTPERGEVMRRILRHPNAWAIIEGGPEVKAHQLMLELTSSGVASLTEDHEWLARCLAALLHPDYRGNTREQIPEMLESAKRKNLGSVRSEGQRYDPGTVGPIPLGFTNDGRYAFRDPKRHIVVLMTANQLLSPYSLLGLAPSSFWRAQFRGGDFFDAMAAGEALIKACLDRGPFLPARIRGRGIWLEDGRVVINLGGAVVSDKYEYLCFEPIELAADATFDAARLLALLERFNWKDPNNATLLLGWIALAPICGVLSWRPHCFVFGPPRSGKTTIHAIARDILTPLVIAADGGSSEAGIRQTLGPDSLAIILDEFESDQSGTGLRQVLRLARSASSADTPVLRGTPEGKAMQFALRTAFFFAAVNPRGLSPADSTRIVLLELLMHENDRETARLIHEEERALRPLGPQWCAYMASLAHEIGPAVDAMDAALTSGDRRHRQNFGTLLGSAFVALNGRSPSADEAKALAERFSVTVKGHEVETERDDAAEALEHLLTYPLAGAPIGQWIGIALQGEPAEDAPEEFRERWQMATTILAQLSMVLRKDGNQPGLLIQNRASGVESVFRYTRWGDNAWRTALRKLQGAFTLDNPVQFPLAGKARGFGIPIDRLPDDPVDRGDDGYTAPEF
jgi:hypothetical protein